MMKMNRSHSNSLIYEGIMLQSEPTRIEFDEGYYIGTVDENGRMAGYGKAVWNSGDTYEGDWLDDVMHGKGVYTWADGDCYDGEYRNGAQNGVGVLRDSTGVYTGEWGDDMRQGIGKMEYVGGSVYEGEWMANMRHGQGVLTEENAVVYHGEFVRNEKEGRGTLTNPNGDVYEGEFARGKPNGKGTYVWADGSRYVGSFKDGLKHGQGCEWLANGDWVAGTFVNGEHDHQQMVHKAVVAELDPEGNLDVAGMEAQMKALDLEKLRMMQRGPFDDSGTPSCPQKWTSVSDSTALNGLSKNEKSNVTNGSPTGNNSNRNNKGGASSSSSTSSVTPGLRSSSQRVEKEFTAPSSCNSIGDGSNPSSLLQSRVVLTDADLEGWRQLKIIGKGSFGAVFEALLVSGRTVCCKVIELGSLSNREEMEKLRNEIALMKRLHHPNIVQYYGSQEDREKCTLNIFMEFVSGGSVNTFVKKFKTIPLPTVRQWTYQMLCGVKYLHDCGIVHRDIKGDNVLVSLDGIIKLADFGCSKAIDGVCSKTHGCVTMVGTPYWMAPEVIKCEAGGYGMKSDIWSIGCTVVEMITGKPPWPECNSMWAAIYKIAHSVGLPTEIPKDLDPKLMNFLELCFERDPKMRPTAETLLQHPFLAL